MPTYSYVCRDCGHAFDIQQAFTDDALTTCPACEGSLRKVFSAVGVVFKGSGFYCTDSRGSGSSSTNGKAPASPEKGSDTGSAAAGAKDTAKDTSKASSTSAGTSPAPSSSTPSASASSSSTAAG